MSKFDALSFWDQRHARNYGPESVGYAGLGVPYNEWMYRVRERVVRRNLHKQKVKLSGKDVLDIGSGTGFYVRLWKKLAAMSVTGSDFSPFAVAALKEKFPQHRFVQLDISGDMAADIGTFDMVSAFDILYHIVDDASYARAIANISAIVRPGGYFIFSENVTKTRETLPHQVSRTEAEIRSHLAENGFEVILRAPMFFFMNRPLKSSSLVLATNWRIVSSILYRIPKAGGIIGALLYPAELLSLCCVSNGPATEMYICQRRSACSPG